MISLRNPKKPDLGDIPRGFLLSCANKLIFDAETGCARYAPRGRGAQSVQPQGN